MHKLPEEIMVGAGTHKVKKMMQGMVMTSMGAPANSRGLTVFRVMTLFTGFCGNVIDSHYPDDTENRQMNCVGKPT
jgi:hypothetical protein